MAILAEKLRKKDILLTYLVTIITLLPLFRDGAHSPAMISASLT